MELQNNQITLVDRLKNLFPDSSQNSRKKWIEAGRISVNDRVIKKSNHLVNATDTVELLRKKKMSERGIEILFEDEHLIVIIKPAGLLSVDSLDENEISAHQILKNRTNSKVYPVHRLDEDTSGVMLFTYTELARDSLKEQFFHHTIERQYIGMVKGKPFPTQGKWEHHLFETKNYESKVSRTGDGKLAITNYEVTKTHKVASSMRFTLHTGRRNQIRVQCAHEGFPIIGDRKYGDKHDLSKRLYLHAEKLSFTHPTTEKKLTFIAKCPWKN